MTDDQTLRRFNKTAEKWRDLGPKGIDPEFGAGLVDSYQAMLSLVSDAVGQGTVGTAAAPGETRQ